MQGTQEESQRSMSNHKTPVTLLTGFLGAGKSTLLNKILSHPNGEKIAVIVNEFGEVGLDHDLIEATSEEVILLASGCICCSIRGDLAQTMSDLIERRDAGTLDFDRVVIETTGLADPAPIQQTLLVDGFLARNVRLEGIVTIVDTVNGPKTLDDQFEAVSQVACADLLLLSKTDLAHAEDELLFRERLQGLNPNAAILPVTKAAHDPAVLWGLSGMQDGVTPQTALNWVTPSNPRPTANDPFANLSGFALQSTPAGFSAHDSRIVSESIVLEAPLQDAVFDHWLDTLIALRGPNILRVKGIVFLEGIEKPFVFHGVQHIFNPTVALENWPNDDTTSRIVVIARDMTAVELRHSLNTLRSNIAPPPRAPLFPDWDKVKPE